MDTGVGMYSSVWEAIGNDGESLYLGYSLAEAFKGYMADKEEGVRIVKYVRVNGALIPDKIWQRVNDRCVRV